jgi:hypothetical protein
VPHGEGSGVWLRPAGSAPVGSGLRPMGVGGRRTARRIPIQTGEKAGADRWARATVMVGAGSKVFELI